MFASDVHFNDCHVQAIAAAFVVAQEVTLPGWVGVAGAVICIFACLVPTLHALRFFTACSLLLSFIFTFISIGLALRDGVSKSHHVANSHFLKTSI